MVSNGCFYGGRDIDEDREDFGSEVSLGFFIYFLVGFKGCWRFEFGQRG